MELTREDAEKLLPIMQALSEGKTLQIYKGGKWIDCVLDSTLYVPEPYRIKQEPKCRPFKSHEECWNEARKHNDFPWIRYIGGGFTHIKSIGKNDVNVESNLEHPHTTYSFAMAYLTLTFNDGTPFGVKED